MKLTADMLYDARAVTADDIKRMRKENPDGCYGIVGCDYRYEWERINTGIKNGTVRVKCLDADDVESSGFKQVTLNGWENSDGNYLTVHPDGNIIILKSRTGTCKFDGKIRNKSELSLILKRIK